MEITKEVSSFNLVTWRLVTSGVGGTEAVVRIEKDGREVHTVFDSGSTIDALYGAFKKALEGFYPELSGLRLVQYSEIHEEDGVRAIAISTDGEGSWSTYGVSGKDNQARLQAIIGAFEYKLKGKEVDGDASFVQELR